MAHKSKDRIEVVDPWVVLQERLWVCQEDSPSWPISEGSTRIPKIFTAKGMG